MRGPQELPFFGCFVDTSMSTRILAFASKAQMDGQSPFARLCGVQNPFPAGASQRYQPPAMLPPPGAQVQAQSWLLDTRYCILDTSGRHFSTDLCHCRTSGLSFEAPDL